MIDAATLLVEEEYKYHQQSAVATKQVEVRESVMRKLTEMIKHELPGKL